jgi:hypothetical protein
VEILGFQPGAEPGIVNLRLVLPKVRLQPALNLEMIQVQLDDRNVLGKITPDIGSTDVQSRDTTALALCFDHHICLLFNVR